MKVLDIIEHFTFGATDLFDAFLSAGYGASHDRIQYQLHKQREDEDWQSKEAELKRKAKQRYYELVYNLKKDNLIEEKNDGAKNFSRLPKKEKINYWR